MNLDLVFAIQASLKTRICWIIGISDVKFLALFFKHRVRLRESLGLAKLQAQTFLPRCLFSALHTSSQTGFCIYVC